MEVEAKMRCVGSGSLLFVGDVTIDGMFTLHGCKILQIKDKTICDIPSIKRRGGWERPVSLPPPVMEEVRKAMLEAAKTALLLRSEFTYVYEKRENCGAVIADVKATHIRTGITFEGIRLCRDAEGKYFVGYPSETLPDGAKRPVFELLGEAKNDFETNLIYQYDETDEIQKTETQPIHGLSKSAKKNCRKGGGV